MRSSALAGWLTPSTPRRRVDRATVLFTVLFIPIAWYAVFRLPFRFPPVGKIVSPSLVFGFNNAVAIACVVILIGFVTLFQLWRRSRAPGHPVPVQWFFHGDVPYSGRIRWTVFTLMIAAHALLTAVMWVSARTSNAWRIDFEASHFLWRLQLMELFGARPYLDFQHEYGPALLYIPILVHRLLAPAGVTLEAAYYLSHLACSILGLGAILLILEHAHIPRTQKEVAFCLLAAAGLMPYMGLNGNLVRYIPPYLSVLLADRAMSRAQGRVWALGVVSALGVVNLLISPEIGAAFGLAWGAYCVFTALTDRPRAILGLAGLVVAGTFGALMLPPEYAGSVLSFSRGANNFPLVPAAHILFYLAILFVAVPTLLTDALSARGRQRALLFSMATMCVVMIPGALGRADPPHVLFFSLGVALLLFVQAAMRSRRGFALYAVVYAVVIIGGTHVSNARVFYGASLRSLHPENIVDFVRRQEPEMTDTQLDRLEQYPPLGLPFCSYGTDRRTMAYLWSRRQIDPEYYCGIIGVYTEDQLSRKLADTTRHEYLLVRKGWLGHADPCSRHVAVVRSSFIYPGPIWCRQEALESDLAVIRAIITHYQVAEELGPYVVMRRAGRE
jgi:uncharacterized membrane protein YecN with MAPEG domain